MSESLKQKTAKGLFWGAMNSGSTQILNLIFGIVLGRMLSPEIYSVVAILTIFVAIAGDLQSSGFTQALVNIRKPEDRDYNSVFSFNVVMSVLMYSILFLCAPLIADFYDRPYLTEVSRILFLTFLISSLGIAHGGYMMKNMMNKEMAIIGFVSLIVSGATGITLAFLGKSYWALVWQQIAYISVNLIGKFYFVKDWRPRLSLDFGPVKRMAPFAMNILVTKIVNTVSNNILTNIFGKLFPDRLVGNYSQAYKWDTMANSLVGNTVGQIAQAVLVEASPSDSSEGNRELQVFRKMLRFTCFLSMPLMLGFALVANEFILITIGDKWAGCVPLLQVLCISGAFVPLYTMYQNLAMSQGRSDIFMWLNIGQIVLQILIVMLFYSFSMLIMVCAYSVFMILWLIPWHHFTGRLIRYRWTDAFKDIAPFALSAAFAMAVTYWATNMISHLYILIAIRFVLAAAIYYGIMKMAKVQILKECEQFIFKKLKK
mgnify:FL=1